MIRAAPPLLLLVLCFLAAPAGAVELRRPTLPQGGEVHLHADTLTRDEKGLITAEGNVRLVAGALHIAADRATYDPERGVATAEGRVTMVEGRTVARARKVTIDLLMESAILEEAAFFQKEEPQDPEALLTAEDATQLQRLGRNEVQLHADQLVRLQDGSFYAVGPNATICDCKGKPDWEIGASSATISEGSRLHLRWPVFYAKGVPIFAAPYFSLPLTNDRRSGLLAPNVSLLGRRGPSYEQPLYLVFGDSYDMTVSAGYFFGNSRPATNPQGQVVLGPDGEPLPEEVAFRGPRGTLELRWAPRIGTSGRGFVAYGYDQSLVSQENLEAKQISNPGVTGYNPNRFAIQLDQADAWDRGYSDRIALNLVSDRNYISDFTDDIVLRGDEALRSTAWAAGRWETALAAVSGTYFQDLRPPFQQGVPVPPGFEETVRLFGDGQRDTFAKLPAAAVDVARYSLPGEMGLSLHLGTVRFAPLTSAGFGDWGTDGLGPGDIGYPGPDPDGTEGDGFFEPGELPAAWRLSIRPTLSRPILFGRFLSVAPFAGWREELYDFEQRGTGVVGWGLVGAAVHTELARSYGGVRHAWIPRAEARTFLPAHDRGGPTKIYDELDTRPLVTTTQARVALRTRLDVPAGEGGTMALEGELGQDATLSPEAELAESFLEAAIRLGPASGSGLFRWDPLSRDLTEAVARLALETLRGDELRLSYRRLGPEGSERIRAIPDALFSDPEHFLEVPSALLGSLQQVGAGATFIPLPGLSLSYDLLFLPTLETARLLEQRATVAYVSSCRCWGGALHFAKRRDEALSAWVSFHLGEF